MHILSRLADLLVTQAAEGGQPAGDPGGLGSYANIGMIVLMVGVFYFLLIRPASKQRKQQQEMLNSLKKDDEVVTAAGFYGKIVAIDDRIVTLEIADKVKVKMLRDRVAGRWVTGPTPDKK